MISDTKLRTSPQELIILIIMAKIKVNDSLRVECGLHYLQKQDKHLHLLYSWTVLFHLKENPKKKPMKDDGVCGCICEIPFQLSRSNSPWFVPSHTSKWVWMRNTAGGLMVPWYPKPNLIHASTWNHCPVCWICNEFMHCRCVCW